MDLILLQDHFSLMPFMSSPFKCLKHLVNVFDRLSWQWTKMMSSKTLKESDSTGNRTHDL